MPKEILLFWQRIKELLNRACHNKEASKIETSVLYTDYYSVGKYSNCIKSFVRITISKHSSFQPVLFFRPRPRWCSPKNEFTLSGIMVWVLFVQTQWETSDFGLRLLSAKMNKKCSSGAVKCYLRCCQSTIF